MAAVLVTGATGFAGGALCRSLREQGDDVVAFVREKSNTRELLELGVKCIVVDITAREDALSHFDKFQVVYHLAAAYRTEHASKSTFGTVNVEATRNILEASSQYGVNRIVHCSTVGVQGEIVDAPADENYRYQPGDHYQKSKLDGELLALEYIGQGTPVTVIRPAGLYGPGDLRFLKLFRPISRGRFVMIGTGEVLYHMTYIDDFVQALILAARHPDAIGETFTIAGSNYTSLNTLVGEVARACGAAPPRWRIPLAPVQVAAVVCDRACKTLGVEPPLYPRRVEFFNLDRAFSIEKAQRVLDFNPQFSLREGLERTAQWYSEQRLL
jgi:nucleoside-diphosphate-sugar epimerase